MVLETFGVFRCASCGRVDADGKLLDSAALPLPVPRVIADLPPSVAARQTPPREVVSEPSQRFTPPPPSTTAGAAAVEPVGKNGPPAIFFAGIGMMLLGTVFVVVATHQWCGLVLEVIVLTALASGRPWSRFLSIMFTALELVVIALMLLAGRHLLSPLGIFAFAQQAVVDGVWLYALFHRDTVRYFHPGT